MFTFVIGSMPIFPTSKQHQMRTKTYMSPIKINQYNLLQVKKSSDTSAILRNRKLQTDRHNPFFKINRVRKKVSRLKDENVEKIKFTLLLYSRLPPRQYMTRVWPIKGGLYLLGPPFDLKLYWFTWKNCWVIITFIFNI